MKTDQFWTRIIFIVSAVISLAVAFLILGPRPQGVEGSLDVSMLPLFNASLNGLTIPLLVYGFILIKPMILLSIEYKNKVVIIAGIAKHVNKCGNKKISKTYI